MIRSRTGVSAAVLAAFVATGCGHEETYTKPSIPVRIERVAQQLPEGGIRYAGALEPNVRVDLAFKVPGYVAVLATTRSADGAVRPIQDGDRVTRGMLLAQVRQEDVQARLAQARSAEAEAEAGLRHAQEALARAKALYGAKSLTRPDLDAAQGAHDSVEARLAGARARVQEAQNAVVDSALRSPIDGVVVKRLVEVGSLVGAGTPGFVLADTRKVKVAFGVPDVTVGALRAAEHVPVSLEALPGRTFDGRVTRIAPVADPKTRAFDVEVTLPNADDALKPGMVASLQLPGGGTPRQPLAVPLTAIVRSARTPGGYAVFIVEGDGDAARAVSRDVGLGEMVGNRVEVTSGLRPGDRVVVSGATIVTDRAPVAVVL